MRTRESEEMYLETILILQGKKKNVRSIDVVEEINYAKSSVSRAVNLLERRDISDLTNSDIFTLPKRGKNAPKMCTKNTTF